MENMEVNTIYTDEFNKVSGIFLYNKPPGVSSHDIVYKFRREFKTKKVGHAGTLDPFADGLLVLLVGKATKLSDKFLNTDKEYRAKILFGIETNSGDPEGEITSFSSSREEISKQNIEQALIEFKNSYTQFVPVFSSVKVGGKKLRELARSHDTFMIEDKRVKFYKKDKLVVDIDLPYKEVKILGSTINEIEKISKENLVQLFKSTYGNKKDVDINKLLPEYYYADITLTVSKGTYIRQFAIDLGKKLNIPSMLITLTRTKVGEFTLDNTYEFKNVND